MWTVLTAGLALTAQAHMPKFEAVNSAEFPEDLGDITKNSWAVSKRISPEEVHYFKINVPKTPKKKAGESEKNHEKKRFMMTLTVPPGKPEENFTFYMAAWGFEKNTKCSTWPDGWGRRLADTWRKDKSTIRVGRSAIPKRVKISKAMKKL